MAIPGEHTTTQCWHCRHNIDADAENCIHCGVQQPEPDIDDAIKKQQRLVSLAIFFGVYLLVCLVSNFTKHRGGLVQLLVTDGVLAAFTMGYVILFWQELKSLFRWNHFSMMKALGYASSSVLAATVITYAVKWLNKTVFGTDAHYYFAFSHLRYARLVTILVMAVQPALFEEMAFRGVLQEGLGKVADSRQAIFITAFLFTLLHMSFITFFWLMPLALWLGYVRRKEKTLWYGVLIHGCFNTTAVFLEFFDLHLL